eukprot:TRINITY_DN62742_c0_g1_i1.p1 TRINITY_DN62742_c0_g1~~TRINITY_DN62742_c0_g1_i1.p1  ORF type:complete len:394 (+),score=45.64 TRINITY_DN62742_c0_g1_i1:67-1248(+)
MAEPARARIALVGAGWWSQGWHLPHLSRNPDCDLVAIVDPSELLRSTLNPDMLQLPELGKHYGVPTFRSHTDLFKSDLKLDGVVIGASHAAHHSIGMAALSSGLNVFMEKPMTTDSKEAKELLDAVTRTGKLFMVNNTANWRPQTQKAHEWVATGRIGVVQHVSCYMGNSLLWLFEDPANAGWCFPTGTMVGNGFAWGQLSHTLAWVLKVSGLIPSSVICDMNYSEKTGADMYDAAIVRCTTGAIICIQGVATLAGEKPKGDGDERPSGKQAEHRIYGSEGYLSYNGVDTKQDSGGLILRRHDGQSEDLPGFDWEDGEQDGIGPLSLQAFIAGCRGKTDIWNGTDARIGYLVVCILEGMYRSARNDGRREALTCSGPAECMRTQSCKKRPRSA